MDTKKYGENVAAVAGAVAQFNSAVAELGESDIFAKLSINPTEVWLRVGNYKITDEIDQVFTAYPDQAFREYALRLFDRWIEIIRMERLSKEGKASDAEAKTEDEALTVEGGEA